MVYTVLRLPEEKSRTGLSRSTIYQRIAEGKFPRPTNFGGRAVGWLEAELESRLRERIRDSREAP